MKTLNLCKSLSRNLLDNNAEATMLYATNDKVDDYNHYKILEYEGDLVQYVAEDSGDTKRLARLTVSKTLWLKVGIPVTLLRNLVQSEAEQEYSCKKAVSCQTCFCPDRTQGTGDDFGQVENNTILSKSVCATTTEDNRFLVQRCLQGHCSRLQLLQIAIQTDLNENDDDAFDDDFNQVIQDLDKKKNRIMDFDLPEDFLISDLFESLKIKTVITPFQSKINDILSTISMEHLKIFSISQFVVISKFIGELNIKEPRNVQPKELVKFYENVHIYLTSLDYKVQCVEMFSNDFSDENMNICYKIHEAIRSYLLKQKALVYKIEKLNTVQRFVDGHSKAKLRYVGGYCVAKLRHNYSKQKDLHRFSTSSESQFSYEKASVAVYVFNYLSEEEQYLKVQSSDQASLKEIERNQNLARSLTHVSDGAFAFFTNICYQCLTLLNGTNVIKHGENIYQFCLTIISSDKKLREMFDSIIFSNVFVEDQRRMNRFLSNIYEEILNKFLMVFFKQFKKDLKSAYHVEKTLAHRK
ncbi:hypothetical protein MAR_035191 [Mya arenaria]|uniref:Uncharacterized protein n=1 Tax=Mya arenaria TaxID=6604 RepID=A0ABY7EJE9_MYAAR|nr:hypothetical protein MAR_035191 [Mya arenaria]